MNKLFGHIEKQIIIDWLESMEIKNYNINNDLTVDVNGDVNLRNKNLKKIPIQFGTVTGFFSVSNNKNLTSLVGSPKSCEIFSCSGCNSLKNLIGSPKDCEEFYCDSCTSLTSLGGAPEKCKEFSCFGCDSLTNLVGATKEYVCFFRCCGCIGLTSLNGAPEKCKRFYCYGCGGKFTKEDVLAVCKAGEIIISRK